MVDFNKHILNSDKFRPSAIFYEKHGCYTLAPRGTTDYIQFWDQETKRCLNGYVAPDGDAITGYHYFYLNYSPIQAIKEVEYVDKRGNKRKRRERIFAFPNFWDYDYYYFNAIEEAEEEGKHMAVLKSRQRGYSFKGASMLVRNYELIPGSKNFAVASEQTYLTSDGLLTKAFQIMDFIDQNTAWAKKRLTDTRMERESGFKITDEFGNETKDGYQSLIKGITLKNDPERIRGTRGKLVLWEEGGKFPGLLTAWRIEQPAVETDDGKAFGLCIAFGTGGTEGGSFDGLKELFYKPDAYNVLSFPNIWDDNAADTRCGFFVPSWSNMESLDENGNQRFMDKDGNSRRELAVQELMNQRNKVKDGGASQQSIDRFISERPLKPQEAVLELGKNIFPRKLLMDQLTRIRTNKKLQSMKHIVDLSWGSDGKVEAHEKKSGDITTYHLKKDDKPEGSVVIWEYPVTDPPFGLYIGGCLTPGEKVCTQRGLIPVEQVCITDKLVNKDGDFVEIKNIQIREKKDECIYKIKPSGSFRTTTFTGEHPIWTANRGFVKASDLNKDDILEIPNLYEKIEQDDESKPYEEVQYLKKLAYFYGLFVGDGFLNKNGNSYDIYLSISKKEEEFAQFYDQFIKEIFQRTCVHVHKENEQTRRFTHKTLYKKILDDVGNSAYTKRIPKWVIKGDDYVKKAFLLGYLDTDGSVFKDRGKVRVNFTSVNLELLEDLQDLLFSLHISSSIVIHQKQCINAWGGISKQSYRLNIPVAHSSTISSYVSVYFGRKEKILEQASCSKRTNLKIKFPSYIENEKRHSLKKIWIGIDNIEKSKYTGIVYNFECNTHTYMCRNILTHNCDPLTNQRGIIGQKRQKSRTDNTVLILQITKGCKTV